MFTRICIGLVLLVAMPAWSQVEPSATGPPAADDAMRIPPSVSGESYPTMTASETRSNELRTGLSFETAYDDNVLLGGSTTPIADVNYSIRPTIAFDELTPRRHQTFTYAPNFTFYQRTSALNEADQSASASFQYRMSPHTTLNLRDSLQKSTNVFNQPYGGVSGSSQSITQGIVAPFADQLSNATSVEMSYQFSANGMIGAGGSTTILSYLDPAQAFGLPNSNSRGGSSFYNLRLPNNQYIGVTYQYSMMTSNASTGDSETQIHTIYSFYTLYLGKAFSISVSGGPQHFDVSQSPFPASASWTPSVTGSIGWQRERTNFAASYSRSVTGAGGLVGAFKSNNASASARLRLARNWTAGFAGSYAIQKNVLPAIFSSSPGGHSVSGTYSVQHPISERFVGEIGYARLHQGFSDVGVTSQNPDGDREYISISYQFSRPLGR